MKLTSKPVLILVSLAAAILLFAGGYFWHSQIVAPAKQATTTRVQPATKTGYAKVNGLDMYYEIHGSGGKPLVLLHGGLSNIASDFGKILPRLAKGRQVIAVEQQGHGHTADIDRPLSYEQMADDTAAFLKQMNITNADFAGYSMGSGIAEQIAISHPEIMHRLVLISPYFNNDGFYPASLEAEKTMKGEDLEGTPFFATYKKIAPKPEQWRGIVEKIRKLDVEDFKGWSPEAIAAIKAPTLIMLGDSDIIRPEHIVEMFRLRGGGVPGGFPGVDMPESQLVILPATTHFDIVAHDNWLLSTIPAFLDKATKK